MPAWSYYSEWDPYCAQWLRNLIAAGHIAPGEVDERSITDVRPDDLRGFTQCHFFAGIGIWSLSARLAGWPDDRPLWTGSCPCPPFSLAGKGQRCPACGSKRNLCHPRKTGHFICLDCGCDRHADERHLWPEFSRLIRECRPAVVFGEQVASQDGRHWLDVVSADLWLARYGVGSADFCSAGVGAPHIRQRLYWVADSDDARLEGWRQRAGECASERAAGSRGMAGRLADTDGGQRDGLSDGEGRERNGPTAGWQQGDCQPAAGEQSSRVAEPNGAGLQPRERHDPAARHGHSAATACGDDRHYSAGPTNGFWRDSDWLFCRDGKWRPVESGTFPLAHGDTARMVVTCSCCKTETRWINASPQAAGAIEVLQILPRPDYSEATAEWSMGEHQHFQEASILRSQMFRIFASEADKDQTGCPHQGAAGMPAEFLQSVRFLRATSGASSGQKPIQQQPREPRIALCEMSSDRAQEGGATIYLRGLRRLVFGAVPSESEQNLFCPVCEDMGPHLCRKEVGARVGQLRAYGNAINAEAAAQWIGAFLDCERMRP